MQGWAELGQRIADWLPTLLPKMSVGPVARLFNGGPLTANLALPANVATTVFTDFPIPVDNPLRIYAYHLFLAVYSAAAGELTIAISAAGTFIEPTTATFAIAAGNNFVEMTRYGWEGGLGLTVTAQPSVAMTALYADPVTGALDVSGHYRYVL